MGHGDPPPRYAYVENGPESLPMVSGSPRYQVIPTGQKRNGYQSVESAFIARTAVVSKIRYRLRNHVIENDTILWFIYTGTTTVTTQQ